ncbi:MAG: helix-turn-helix transcriptional regulator [Pseudomonadota bacterium]
MGIDKNTKNNLKFIEKIAGKLTLGRLLWAIRQAKDCSQTVFAEKLGISQQQLCDIEHNRKSISIKMAAHYAEILGYPPEQFIRLSVEENLERTGLKMTVDIQPKRSRSRLKPQFA